MKVQRGWHELGRWARRLGPLPWRAALWPVAAAIAACSGGGSVNIANSQTVDPATVDFPIFYVKRAVPTDQAGKLLQDDLRIMRDVVPSADLYMRASAAPSAAETNITAPLTAGASWDVKDVDTSADGTRVIFAMRGPLAVNQDPKKPPSWRIYQYTIATKKLAAVINPSTDPDPPTVNDVSPHYLPDGRIVFSSTRQTQSQGILLDQGDPQFSAQDEDRTEPAFVLEVMNADGTGIHQISFNQSHDRDATVLASGRVLWARWDNMAAGGQGPDVAVLRQPRRHGSRALLRRQQPRQWHQQQRRSSSCIRARCRMAASSPSCASTPMSMIGGNLVIIDGLHYVENTQPLLANATLTAPAQTPATPNDVLDHPRALPRRALQLRLPAAGWHQSHPRQLERVPPARQHPDPADYRAVQFRRACRSQPAGCTAAVQRLDVRPAARTPCSRSCSRSKASW